MFQKLTYLPLLLLTVFSFTSCRDTPESLMEDAIEHLDDGTEILNHISKNRDVSEDLERLEKWVTKANKIIEKLRKMENEFESNKELQRQYERPLETSFELFNQAYKRASKSTHGSQVKARMDKMKIF